MSGAAGAMPLVPALELFDGNNDDASIAANLIHHPGVRRFAELVSGIEARPDVQAVLVRITDAMADDESSWPYSDTVYVLTSAPAAVHEWFAEVEPDEVEGEFADNGELPTGAPPLARGMALLRVWWD